MALTSACVPPGPETVSSPGLLPSTQLASLARGLPAGASPVAICSLCLSSWQTERALVFCAPEGTRVIRQQLSYLCISSALRDPGGCFRQAHAGVPTHWFQSPAVVLLTGFHMSCDDLLPKLPWDIRRAMPRVGIPLTVHFPLLHSTIVLSG